MRTICNVYHCLIGPRPPFIVIVPRTEFWSRMFLRVRPEESYLFEENTLNIFVGNLSFNTTNEGLQAAFAQYGAVDSAQVIMDRQTGRSRGFGFVEMPDDGEAQAAISAMNGADLDGRPLTVNEARPRAPRNDRRW